jgi:hypothetical protein
VVRNDIWLAGLAGSDPATAICDGSRLVLSRPDQHVAWRGDRPPSDPLALIDHVRGVVN